MPRTFLWLFLILSAIFLPAQTASELTPRHSDRDVEQRFVRLGVTLMVRYSRDRTACEMLIEPMRSISSRDESAKYMRPEIMTEIIDEVVPEASRGKLLLGVVTKSGCNDLETEDYENVTIHRFRHRCRLPNPEIEGTATITSKSPSCTAINGSLPGVQKP